MKLNKKKYLMFLLVALLAITSLVGCASNEGKPASAEGTEVGIGEDGKDNSEESKEDIELYISAAASLTDAVDDLKELYQDKHPQVTLHTSYASSGDLQSQIQEGAPSDVFISAAQNQMDTLEEKGLLEDGTRETLLLNKVVLITPEGNDLGIESVDDLKDDNVEQIAIGDPAHVPAGQYTEEMLQNLKMWDSIETKLRLATNVRSVLDWVETGEVDAGFVYMTDAMTSDLVKVITEAPEASHKEVSYPIAMIKDSRNKEAAEEFMDFASSDEAKEVLEGYGFTVK